mmetsp:Transcript_2401/g.4389  ORF Transcript_2401/g.4389 Transcript_2401/m.4389 type:complete len:299 (+) Transcript_2401:51-947(+)
MFLVCFRKDCSACSLASMSQASGSSVAELPPTEAATAGPAPGLPWGPIPRWAARPKRLPGSCGGDGAARPCPSAASRPLATVAAFACRIPEDLEAELGLELPEPPLYRDDIGFSRPVTPRSLSVSPARGFPAPLTAPLKAPAGGATFRDPGEGVLSRLRVPGDGVRPGGPDGRLYGDRVGVPPGEKDWRSSPRSPGDPERFMACGPCLPKSAPRGGGPGACLPRAPGKKELGEGVRSLEDATDDARLAALGGTGCRGFDVGRDVPETGLEGGRDPALSAEGVLEAGRDLSAEAARDAA